MSAKGRVRCVDLPDHVAGSIFRDNVLAGADATTLFSYSELSLKKRPIWSECMVHRSILTDAFQQSGGHLLNQVKLQASLVLFMIECKKSHSVGTSGRCGASTPGDDESIKESQSRRSQCTRTIQGIQCCKMLSPRVISVHAMKASWG